MHRNRHCGRARSSAQLLEQPAGDAAAVYGAADGQQLSTGAPPEDGHLLRKGGIVLAQGLLHARERPGVGGAQLGLVCRRGEVGMGAQVGKAENPFKAKQRQKE